MKTSESYMLLVTGIWTWMAALLLLIVQYFYSSRFIKDYEAFLGCILLMTTVCFSVGTLNIRMDMLQVLFIFLALLEFFNIYRGVKNNPLIMWVYIGIAILIKGPAGILVPVIVMLSFLLLEKKCI